MTGCVSINPSIPEGYVGPTANVKDSKKVYSTTKVDFFYLDKIDGKGIENSRYRTGVENYGNGLLMSPIVLDREVPARSALFTIEGRTEYAAPILAFSNPVYEIAGTVKFTPEEGKTYIVKGELTEEYSAVWIEELESGKLIGEKVEIQGSAKIGFLKK